MSKNLDHYIETQTKRWLRIYNEKMSTDAGTELAEFAKGSLLALINLRHYLDKQTTEEKNETRL